MTTGTSAIQNKKQRNFPTAPHPLLMPGIESTNSHPLLMPDIESTSPHPLLMPGIESTNPHPLLMPDIESTNQCMMRKLLWTSTAGS